MRGGRKAQEERDIYIHINMMTDLHCCMAETHNIVKKLPYNLKKNFFNVISTLTGKCTKSGK